MGHKLYCSLGQNSENIIIKSPLRARVAVATAGQNNATFETGTLVEIRVALLWGLYCALYVKTVKFFFSEDSIVLFV